MSFLKREQQYAYGYQTESQGLMFKPFKTFLKKQIIYQQGNKADQFFLIKSGAVKLSKIKDDGDELVCHYLVAGDILGEWSSLLDQNMEYQYHAMATENNTTLEKVEIGSLNEFVRNNTFIALSSVFLERIQFMEKRHFLLAKQTASYRIKEILRILANRSGRKVGAEILLKINLSHQDIAQMADTSRQMVTTTLNEMRAQGKIYYTRDRILFRDLENIHI